MLPLITLLLPVLEKVVGGIITDKAQAAQTTLDIQKALIDNQGDLDKALYEAAKAQIDVNAAEASNPSLFVSGWRPAVGWVCVFGCIFGFILQPLMAWAVGLLSVLLAVNLPAPPALDMNILLGLLGGLLGIGGLRTVEKVKGVSK